METLKDLYRQSAELTEGFVKAKDAVYAMRDSVDAAWRRAMLKGIQRFHDEVRKELDIRIEVMEACIEQQADKGK